MRIGQAGINIKPKNAEDLSIVSGEQYGTGAIGVNAGFLPG
jgi:hypothetical protein